MHKIQKTSDLSNIRFLFFMDADIIISQVIITSISIIKEKVNHDAEIKTFSQEKF